VILVLSRNNAANSRRSATALAVLHNFHQVVMGVVMVGYGWLWVGA